MPKNPAVIIVLILLIVLLFGSSKLPDLARNLGRSMRIVKKEFREMKAEDDASSTTATPSSPAVPPTVSEARPTAPSTPAEPAGDDAPKA